MQLDVYALGNALVDFEFEVTEERLNKIGLDKSKMTLIDNDTRLLLATRMEGEEHTKAG